MIVKRLQKLTCILAALSSLMLDGYADIAVFGGDTSPPVTYEYTPILNTLLIGETFTTPIAITNAGQIGAVAVSSDGVAFLGGENTQSLTPLIYTLNLITNELTLLSNPNSNQGAIVSIATYSNGNAIFAGLDQTNMTPLAYLLEKGSNTLIPITFPLDAAGYIRSIAVGSDNVAIMVGNTDDGLSFIYKLEPESLTATSVSLTAAENLFFIKVAIGPDLRAIIGGSTGNITNSPVIYALDSGSETAYTISIPSSDEGSIESLAIRSDGTAFLGGSNTTNTTPSIYILPQGALSASIFDTSSLPSSTFYTVSVASNGSTIFGGVSGLTSPIIYRLNSELNSLTLVNTPNENLGYLISSAADSQGNVILTGQDFTTGLSLIYSVSSGSDTALFIQSVGSVEESIFFCVGMYIPAPPPPPTPTPPAPSPTPYDINRIKPMNAEQVIKAKLKLNQAGMR